MRKLIFILFLVLLSSLVIAAPPTTVVSTATQGFDVVAPLIDPIKKDQNFTFHFHVFNKTTGYPVTNESATCDFHLYNSKGEHLLKVYKINFDPLYDFELTVNGSYFNEVGHYNYIVQCNDTKTGGFSENLLLVSSSGRDVDLSNYLPLIVAIAFLSFIFLYFAFNLDKDHFLLKLLSIFFALVTVILLPNVFVNGVTETSKTFLKIPLWFFRIFVTYFSIYIFYHWAKKSEKFAKWVGQRK